MDSGYIGKVEKAKRYAEERERIQFISFVATIDGDNATHTVSYDSGQLVSENKYFQTHGYSAHTMAMERILRDMIISPAESDQPFAYDDSYISKVEKAKRYAEDPSRITFLEFKVVFAGDNSKHFVNFEDGVFDCDCAYFQSHGNCQHTMALERVLGEMLRQ